MTIKFSLETRWISDNWFSRPENVWEMSGKNWKAIGVTLKNSNIGVTMEVGVKVRLITGRLVESLFKKQLKKQQKKKQLPSPNSCSHRV